jgi:ATP-dependent Clp protease ATP-binding subunit ClpX
LVSVETRREERWMLAEHEVTPRRLFEELQKRVVGQEDAARAISKVFGYAAWRHQKLDEGFKAILLPKGLHALLVGPSGVGKTFIVETAAELTGRPFIAKSATDITQEGYIGLKLHDILLELVQKTGGDLRRAQRGIIFIDELDKVPKHECSWGPDVNGAGVQFSLLRAVQGTIQTIGLHKDKGSFDTSELTFVFAGVFEGMDEDVDPNALPVEEFVRRGMDRQLIERIAVRARLNALTLEDRRRLLSQLASSPLKRLQNALHIEGVDLQIDGGAEEAILSLLGDSASARALETVVADRLGTILFELTEYQKKGIRVLQVDEDTILERRQPFKAPGEPISPDLSKLKTSSDTPLPEKTITLTDTTGWSLDDVLNCYFIRKCGIKYDSASEAARHWWNSLEQWAMVDELPRFVTLLHVAEELLMRNSTVEEFFNVSQESRCFNSRGWLHFLDYRRIFDREQAARMKGCVCSGDTCTAEKAGEYQFAGYRRKQDELPVDEDKVCIELAAGDVIPDMNGKHCWWMRRPD